MIAVIDTNILVSALWKPAGNASMLISRVISGDIQVCYDHRIISEYREVLTRPRFCFSPEQVDLLLDVIIREGISVVPEPLPSVTMTDEDDRPFYEVARFCNAPLVTGNLRHFPEDPLVISWAEFCHNYF